MLLINWPNRHQYDYQLSKVQTSLGDEVLRVKIMVLPMVTILSKKNFVRFAAYDINADKLPLEMELVTCVNNTS